MKVSQFSTKAVIAFLSALSIALKVADRTPPRPERRDLFLLVEAEIQQFFEHLPEHENLNLEDLRDLGQIREILRTMYHDADLVILDPKEEPEH